VLQFGGASGSGYLSGKETRAAMEELNKLGEFKNGAFRRKEPLWGKKNVDGNQAIWEHHHQRPIAFPKPRYPQPIMMDPKNYAWVPLDGAPGVSEKPLGVFTERRTQMGLLKLDPGASWTGMGRSAFLVLRGTGTIGDAAMRALTALYLDRGETATFTAQDETEIMHFGLPNLAGLEMSPPLKPAEDVQAEAAE
jgi:predicted DNA-binding transcriptional regulator AlpA